MSVLWAIFIGLIAGALAKFIMPGKDPGGFLVTILLGIGGAVVANLLGHALGWYGEERSAGLIGSV
ncbi:MAG TPA: GlsB/YeaQ/YmgE family stress response membrane protein, partial [Candidatus Limnocylindria bacterium]|nr:GlsB/YeaQ/YmgE family stress response membrane protein [Candidatus Limnocylindria bacterium]